MSKKAILVLNEMPENCRECQFEDQDDFRRKNICNATASDRVISDFEDEVDEDERPDWCPLKEPSMNDGLIYKLTWMLNDEKSSYKRAILQETIDALQKEDDADGVQEVHLDGGDT